MTVSQLFLFLNIFRIDWYIGDCCTWRYVVWRMWRSYEILIVMIYQSLWNILKKNTFLKNRFLTEVECWMCIHITFYQWYQIWKSAVCINLLLRSPPRFFIVVIAMRKISKDVTATSAVFIIVLLFNRSSKAQHKGIFIQLLRK